MVHSYIQKKPLRSFKIQNFLNEYKDNSKTIQQLPKNIALRIL